jgi:hypothetical protein
MQSGEGITPRSQSRKLQGWELNSDLMLKPMCLHPSTPWCSRESGTWRRLLPGDSTHLCRCARPPPVGSPGGSSTGRSHRCWRIPGCSAGPHTRSHLWGHRLLVMVGPPSPEIRAGPQFTGALSPEIIRSSVLCSQQRISGSRPGKSRGWQGAGDRGRAGRGANRGGHRHSESPRGA